MKTLLILGCGYVGSAFAVEAKRSGFRVLALTRNENKAIELESHGVEAMVGRVEKSGWHAWVGKDIDWALNCVGSSGGGLEGYQKSYIDGNRSFVQWMRASSFSGIALFTSSVSVYPDSGGDWVKEEEASPDNERGRLILDAEQVFLEGDLPCQRIVARLGGIYGPNRHGLLDRLREDAASFAVSSERLRYHLNLIRLEDICSALRCLFEHGGMLKEYIFNVVDDQPSMKRDILTWVAGNCELKQAEQEAASVNWSQRRGRADRRVSNALLKRSIDWRPAYPSFEVGFKEFVARS